MKDKPYEFVCVCFETDPREKNGHSGSCNRYNRKAEQYAIKKAQQKASQKKIAKVSDKMALALKEYAKLRKQFLEANPKCEVFPDKPSVEVHHTKGRATIELLLDVRYWKAVSREAHQWIELNPEEAKIKGWSLSRLATEPNNTI